MDGGFWKTPPLKERPCLVLVQVLTMWLAAAECPWEVRAAAVVAVGAALALGGGGAEDDKPLIAAAMPTAMTLCWLLRRIAAK